jgi:hypothetical protein
MEDKTNAHKVLLGKPEGNEPPGRPKHRWKDNIKINLKETGSKEVNWIHLAQDRNNSWALVSMVMNLLIPKILGISRLAEQLLASQEGFCSM